MARQYDSFTVKILKLLNSATQPLKAQELFQASEPKMAYKNFYNILFRLHDSGLAEKNKNSQGLKLTITADGQKLLNRLQPNKDGIWKLVIFDIPEKQKKIRTILRAKLRLLHFKKWQNSIWISPYALDEEIEAELNELGKKFFVRLIKTNNINHTADLDKLFD